MKKISSWENKAKTKTMSQLIVVLANKYNTKFLFLVIWWILNQSIY